MNTSFIRLNRSFWVRTVLVGAMFVAIIISAIQLLKIKKAYEHLMKQEVKLHQLNADVLYLDEVLTMSTNMSAFTGDTIWKNRYGHHIDELSEVIDEVYSLLPKTYGLNDSLKVDYSNKVLIGLEKQAFDEIEKGNLLVAQNILNSSEYKKQKKIYSEGIKALREAIDQNVLVKSIHFKTQVRNIFLGLIFSLVCLFLIWMISFKLLIKERDQKKKSIIVKKALAEKEILLQEIHHRVKNNLQIISSLINLQIQSCNPEQQAFFSDIKSRINSMALIHDMLYESDNFSIIDFNEYVRRHVSNLINSMRKKDQKISLNIDVVDVVFNINIAIPLGLLINEIVTNSLKHGNMDNELGEISIRIIPLEGKCYRLLIGDNGIGMKKQVKNEEIDSLGLSLIYSLTEQINGSLKYDEEKKGTHFIIEFEG